MQLPTPTPGLRRLPTMSPAALEALSSSTSTDCLFQSSSSACCRSWSVNPTLPSGLSLDPNTGVVSGTPAAVAAQNNYIVSRNSCSGADVTMHAHASGDGDQH